MNYFLAALVPILAILAFMILLRWGGQRAGPAAWLICLGIAALVFGLTFQVWWVSQVKGLLLSLFVLAVLWPALLLYHTINQVGGIAAISTGLQNLIHERGLLLLVFAWAFSGLLEGLAGFGLPIAVVAPILVGLGVGPVQAVAAVAVGHAWSITFGDMGMIMNSLSGVVKMEIAALEPLSALMLGAACLGCGLGAALILGEGKRWWQVLILGVVMAAVQHLVASLGLVPLAALSAGLAGVLGAVLLSQFRRAPIKKTAAKMSFPLAAALASYGGLALLMAVIALVPPLKSFLSAPTWQMQFPQTATTAGFIIPAGGGQVFRPLVHPATLILLVAVILILVLRWLGKAQAGGLQQALQATWRSATPASLGILFTVGISTMMEACGMTQLLAQGLSQLLSGFFPLVSPLVGMLGAFATGSNVNSNVLFAPLQKSAAVLLGIDPRLLIAAQTAGGALGSMIAPAKIMVGCSTVGLQGKDGEVLRRTLGYGLLIGVGIGILTLIISKLV